MYFNIAPATYILQEEYLLHIKTRDLFHISNWERAHKKHLGPDLRSSQIKSAKSDAHANRLCFFVGGRVAGDPLRMCTQMTAGSNLVEVVVF